MTSAAPLDRAEIQARVEEIWRFVLEKQAVEPGDNFFSLGGDSLKTVEMTAGVEARLGVVIDPFEILERPVLKDFVEFLVQFIAEGVRLDASSGERGLDPLT